MGSDEATRKRRKKKRPIVEGARETPAPVASTEASEDVAEEVATNEDAATSPAADEDAADEGALPKPRPAVDPSRFLGSFPKDPALDALVAAFERGDYAFVRAEAPSLAKRTADADVRRAALELRRRIEPDRLSLLLMGFAFALLVVLAAYYWTHKHT